MLLLVLFACKPERVPTHPQDHQTENTETSPENGFSRLDEVFDIQASAYFGVTSALKPRDAQTYYQVAPPWQDNGDDLVQAWFDIGNNSLLAEIDVGGRIEYPVVRGPLTGFAPDTENYQTTDFLAGSPWSFTVDLGAGPIALDRLEGTSVDVLGNRLFRWQSTIADLSVSFVPFAPSDGQLATPQPRALIAAFRLENTGNTPITLSLAAPAGLSDADHLDRVQAPATLYGPAPYAGANHTNNKNWIPRFAEVGYAVPGYEAVLLFDDAATENTQITLTLAPNTTRVIPFGLMVGGGVEELAFTRDQLRTRSPVDWLNGAWGRVDHLLGTLTVPDDPYIPELMGRYAMEADDGFLFDGTGRLHHDHGGSWVLMGMIAPEYLSALIPGGDLGVSCPPSEATVRWSLYGTTLPPILAAEVYQWSGEAANYGDGSVFETQYRCLVDAILDTQYPGTPLFPSSYIWDGPSRGDYHTGSNIAVWYMLKAGARFAEDLWADPATAATWSAKADAVRDALLSHNVIDSWFDERFVEGAWADGHIDGDVTSHDGEEIMVAEAPIFDFIASDDPRRIRHGIAAMSTENGFYVPTLNAMYWSEDSPVTAPGWLAALSGAADADAQRRALELWRSRTDVDGAMYWWPYDNPATDPSLIRRRMSFAGATPIDTAKVDYATSNALALLIHDVFGLSGDVPDHRVTFRPNVPWSTFDWSDAPVGSARFDVSYVDNGISVEATLINREASAWAATVEVVVPQGQRADAGATGRWYGRDSLSQTATLAPGERLTVTLPYTDEATDPCVNAAWTRLVAAGSAVGDWQQVVWADADDDDVPEGWALRLLVEAQCADSAVDALWSDNLARCSRLGWGDDWAILCASYGTLSEDAVGVMDVWNGQRIGLEPFVSMGEEPLSGEGDWDADGVSNLDEFVGNGGAEGSRARFAEAASGG